MNKLMIVLVAATLCVVATACTDANRAHWGALGEAARVTCFSGGKIIADDFSTGKVKNADGSDGYEFKSATTQRLTQFSGDCVVDYGATKTADFQAVLP